jgi:hypothetical protein
LGSKDEKNMAVCDELEEEEEESSSVTPSMGAGEEEGDGVEDELGEEVREVEEDGVEEEVDDCFGDLL